MNTQTGVIEMATQTMVNRLTSLNSLNHIEFEIWLLRIIYIYGLQFHSVWRYRFLPGNLSQ